jgi:hypothetical protein
MEHRFREPRYGLGRQTTNTAESRPCKARKDGFLKTDRQQVGFGKTGTVRQKDPTGMTPKPLLELELRRIAAPAQASEGAAVYALLPTLEELLGAPGFGRRDPIMLPDGRDLFDPWRFFHPGRAEFRLH